MPSPIRVGDLVQIFNSATDSFDQEGVVSQVLSGPHAYGSSVLPAGSVAVAVDGSRTMWISEEHVGVMLQKAEKVLVMDDCTQLNEFDSPTTSTPDHGRKVLTDKATTGYANANASINSMIGAVSSFFGLGKDAPAIGDALPDTEQTEREDSLESDKEDSSRGFVEGDVVDLWSYESLEWELGGTVSQVLSAPLSLVSMQLPAGSILVSLKGTLRWITPELCSLAVRRSALPKPLKADEDLHFQEGDQVEMRDVHGAWQPALVTAVATFNSDSIPAGSLTVCLQASARSCTIIPEMFGKLVRKPVAMGRKSTDGSAKHDSEDVERWNPDTYLQGDPDKERSDASVGRVSSIASSCKRAASTASQCHSSAGEVQKALSSHSSIRDDDRVSNCHSDPPDSVASQQVIATPMNTSPRQPDTSDHKADINGVNKTWSDHASSELDEENSADLVSKRDDLPSGKLDVKADIETEKPEDSMSKSPSDGTTASGQLTPHLSVSASPCASPATMPQPAPRRPSATSATSATSGTFLDDQRPPSPAGSVHSVRPTVSLRIPDLEDRPSRPNSPCTTPRSCRSARVTSTVEGPVYDRAEKRVLVVGPGFGRELNPQQGQMLDSAGFQVRWVYNLPNPETPCFPIQQFLPVLKQAIDEFQPHLLICASKGGAYATGLWKAGLWDGPTLLINRHPTLTELPKGSVVVLAHGSNDEYYKFRREDLEALMRSGTPNKCYLYYTANSGILGRGYTRQGDKHNMESLKQWDTLPRLCDAAMTLESPELQLMRSWRSMLTQERLAAEDWLGYVPGVRRLWESSEQKGMDDQILFDVPQGTEEYEKVAALFRSQPAVPRAYAAAMLESGVCGSF